MRALWASVQEDPKFLYKVNFWLLIFLIPWTLLLAIPASPLFSLGGEVWYVTLISHIALILSAVSTIAAARVEIKQDEIEKKRDDEDQADLDKVESKVDDIHDKLS